MFGFYVFGSFLTANLWIDTNISSVPDQSWKWNQNENLLLTRNLNLTTKMSTFDGRVKEIPFISVDYFDFSRTPTPKIFFLTHCHFDHMKGLSSSDFQNKLLKDNLHIYGSAVTIGILKRELCYNNIQSQLRIIDIGKPTIITYEDEDEHDQHLQVTAISAGHSPGSVMFFFENEQNILCTGDFRINPLELYKFKVFHTTLGKLKNIDVIYLDSTFFNENYPYFPTRKETSKAVYSLAVDWLNKSPEHRIYLQNPAKYSVEYLFIELSERLKQKIHVSTEKTLYGAIPEMDEVISLNSNQCRIHSGGFNFTYSCCDFYKGSPQNILVIHLTAMKWINYSLNKDPIEWINDGRVDVCLSFHPSYTETVEFLKYLKPNRVELCVVPKSDDEKEQMEELLDNILDEIRRENEKKNGERKKLKFKAYDSFEIKEENVTQGKSPVKIRKKDDLLSSPSRNNKFFKYLDI